MQDSSHSHGNSEDELKLIAAVKRGDVLSVQNLLETVDSIDFENDQGLTPLIEACTNSHLEIIKLLIERGADCNFRNRKVPSPLNLVARKGPDRVDVARLLIDHGAEVDVQDHQGLTSLHWACGRGDLEVARLLINHGADIHIKNPTPLTLAWTSGNLEVAKVLIEHGGDINARINNDTIAPLHRACMQGCMKLASFLIENGADVHVKSIEGKTPLQVALESGRSWDDPLSQNYRDTVKLLVDNGADVLANFNDGRTPLHWALERRLFSFWLVEFLIENGADLHTADNDGKTLLHKVCMVRPWNAKQTNFDAAKLLIERGVNVNGKDGAGETPLHVACRRGEIKLVQLLLTRKSSRNRVVLGSPVSLAHCGTIGKVSGTKYDLVLRITQHEHDTGGGSLKRAATETTVDKDGIVQAAAKKHKPSKPNSSVLCSRVEKRCQASSQKKYESDRGTKNHARDVSNLMRELLNSLEPYTKTDPKLVLDGCYSIVSAYTENYRHIFRPGYLEDFPRMADTIASFTHQVRPSVSQSALEKLADVMNDWYNVAFDSFDVRGCDIHESIHKIRHGDAVPYDKAKAKENRTPPVGSMEWYEQAKKDGTFKVYCKRKGGESDCRERQEMNALISHFYKELSAFPFCIPKIGSYYFQFARQPLQIPDVYSGLITIATFIPSSVFVI